MTRIAQGLVLLCVVGGLIVGAAANQEGSPGSQQKEFEAEVPKTILELQQFRQSNSIHVKTKGGKEGTATLVNLNPAINAWYLLQLTWQDASEAAYHLENARPQGSRILLDEKYPTGLVIEQGNQRVFCDLFGSASANALDQAKASPLIFYPLCDGRLYLRNPTDGRRTNLEAATEFLRDRVWGGESIISLGHILMGDMNRETARMGTETPLGARRGGPVDAPLPALIDPKYADRLLTSGNLGIDLEGAERTGMTAGAWYPANGNPGIYTSILQPNLVDPGILQSYKTTVNNLDGVEAAALCYLVAFDLDRFDLGYALGTTHPRVGWSDHMLDRMKNPALPGPDGIESISPLIATGLVSPDEARKTVATFTAGFKRKHGAFKEGELAFRNHGTHYGFMEDGVVFSKLQPGLSTLYILDDGSIGMKTWTLADGKLLPRIKHARQNGVPVIEFDEAAHSGVPGALVARWGPGNWAGSDTKQLRSMRAGAAIQRSHGKRFLIYAVFSDATPASMVRIFQSYQCDYAMLLDMNALEHTYLAVYRRSGPQMFVDHLVKGMGVLDKSASGELVPRFLGYADNRDFFYVMKRNSREGKP